MLCCGAIAISFNVAAVSAVVPSIAKEFQVSNYSAAKVITFYLIPYGLGALIYAPLTRILTFHRTLCIILISYALSNVLCAYAQNLNQLLFGRVVMGVAASGIIPLGLMLIGNLYEKNKRGRLIGGFFACNFVAATAGIILSGLMHWTGLFVIPAILSTVLSIVVFHYAKPLMLFKHRSAVNYVTCLKEKEVFKLFIFIFFLSFFYHAVHKWYGIYLSEIYGFNQLSISYFFVLTAIGGMIGQNIGGWISDVSHRRNAVFIGIIGLGITIMCLSIKHNETVLGIVLFLISVFWTIGHNGISTALTDYPEEQRPIFASLNSSIRFLGGGIGFWASSYFVKKSFSLTFLSVGILCLIMSLLVNQMILWRHSEGEIHE